MEGVNANNQQVLLLTIGEVDKRIKEALYSTHVGCPETVLYELSQASYHGVFMQHISKAVWSCLESGVSRWLRIQKALSLLTYLALNGSDTCLHEILNNLEAITSIHSLHFPSNQRDIGYLIRDKAASLVTLVCDTQELKRRRKEASELRSRIVSVCSNNGQMATQVLHKPIYALETKPGFAKSTLNGKILKPRFMAKLMGDSSRPNILIDMFNKVRMDLKNKGKTVDPEPLHSMTDYRQNVNRSHNSTGAPNSKPARYVRSYSSSESYTTNNSAYSGSSDGEGDRSNPTYSLHSGYRGNARNGDDCMHLVISVSNSSSSSSSEDASGPISTHRRHVNTGTNHAANTTRYAAYRLETRHTADPDEYYNRGSKTRHRESLNRYTEDQRFNLTEDYGSHHMRSAENNHRFGTLSPLEQRALQHTNVHRGADTRMEPGYTPETHDERYNLQSHDSALNPFTHSSRY